MPGERDWVGWHTEYDDVDSYLSTRLRVVQQRLAGALDAARPGALRLISMCAGQGRDVIGALAEHPRLLADGATVIWTRHRRAPDRTHEIRSWFTVAGFEEMAFDTHPAFAFAVGTARMEVAPLRFRPDQHLFTFLGKGDADLF